MMPPKYYFNHVPSIKLTLKPPYTSSQYRNYKSAFLALCQAWSKMTNKLGKKDENRFRMTLTETLAPVNYKSQT